MPENHAWAYRELRLRVTELMQDNGSASARTVPATPEWTVHDLLAHFVGVSDDVVHGRMEGVASDAWTAKQVERRCDQSLEELLEEWDEHAPAFEALLADGPATITGQALFDASTHEHDLRHALGMPGARDSDAVAFGWTWALDVRDASGAPAIRYDIEIESRVAGVGEPEVAVRAPRFEFVRAMTGRRTAAEISAFEWSCEPRPELLVVAPLFHMRAESLGE